MADREDSWWMVGCDGSLPHFYRARTGRSAVARFRADLIGMERGSGVSLKHARIIVGGLTPAVIDGPLTAERACALDVGWAWATAVCDDLSGGIVVTPAGPCSRKTAVERLGEDRVARMERSAHRRYGMPSCAPD